jgi:hypothetical protein
MSMYADRQTESFSLGANVFERLRPHHELIEVHDDDAGTSSSSS